MAYQLQQSEDALNRLLVRLYETCIDGREATKVLGEVCRFLNAEVLWIVAMGPQGAAAPFWAGLAAADEAKRVCCQNAMPTYRERFARPQTNPWLAGAARHPVGRIITTDSLMDRGQLMRSEFFRQFVQPLGIEETLGANLIKEPPVTAAFSVYRRGARGPFDGDEQARCRALLPHLRRIAQLHLQLDRVWRKNSEAWALLEKLPTPLFVISVHGQVSFHNRAAARLLKKGEPVNIKNGTLVATDRQRTADLHSAIDGALQTAAGRADAGQSNGAQAAGGELRLPRHDGRRPYNVIVSPLDTRGFGFKKRDPATAVFVIDPEQPIKKLRSRMQKLWGFTPAEINVAHHLLQGADLDGVAARLGISKNTARTHLYRVFDKTGVRRQTELIRLLLLGSGHFLAD